MQNTIATYDVLLGSLETPQGIKPAVLIHARDAHVNVPDQMHAFAAPLRKNGTVSFRDASVEDAGDGSFAVTLNSQAQTFTTHGTLAEWDAVHPLPSMENVKAALKQTANRVKEAGDLREVVQRQITAITSRHYPKAGLSFNADDQVEVVSDTSLPQSEAAAGGRPAGKKAKAGPKRRGKAKGCRVWL